MFLAMNAQFVVSLHPRCAHTNECSREYKDINLRSPIMYRRRPVIQALDDDHHRYSLTLIVPILRCAHRASKSHMALAMWSSCLGM